MCWLLRAGGFRHVPCSTIFGMTAPGSTTTGGFDPGKGAEGADGGATWPHGGLLDRGVRSSTKRPRPRLWENLCVVILLSKGWHILAAPCSNFMRSWHKSWARFVVQVDHRVFELVHLLEPDSTWFYHIWRFPRSTTFIIHLTLGFPFTIQR